MPRTLAATNGLFLLAEMILQTEQAVLTSTETAKPPFIELQNILTNTLFRECRKRRSQNLDPFYILNTASKNAIARAKQRSGSTKPTDEFPD